MPVFAVPLFFRVRFSGVGSTVSIESASLTSRRRLVAALVALVGFFVSKLKSQLVKYF